MPQVAYRRISDQANQRPRPACRCRPLRWDEQEQKQVSGLQMSHLGQWQVQILSARRSVWVRWLWREAQVSGPWEFPSAAGRIARRAKFDRRCSWCSALTNTCGWS
ncbi:hypothetical protein GCM10022380_52310 [Amycolatopsis tucumanensis]|uniref:Transposase n=1 Tax=Amycolatopsis tucumanensis TaxID=401106 RepID=A0ABP7IUW3_9PSEU